MNDEQKRKSADETLSALFSTIKNSDEKAVALLTAAGIIFGLSAFSLEILKDKTNNVHKIFINVFGCTYLVLFVLLVTLLVLVIFPRRKALKDGKNVTLWYKNYGEDVQKAIDNEKLKELLYKEPQLEVVEDQIIRCSKISRRKETLLRFSVWVLVALTICLAVLIVLGSIK